MKARGVSLSMLCVQCAAILAVLLGAGCRRDRSVNLEWDAPAVIPDRYRILVDGRTVSEIPPPAIDPSCRCMRSSVRVSPGEHIVRLDACNLNGACTPGPTVTSR
jgi:hypothetical protein